MAKLLVLVLEGWQGRMTSCGIPREPSSVETWPKARHPWTIYYTVPNMMELCWTVR